MIEEVGIITGATFGIEDHGILTMMISIAKDNGTCQGFGGYALDTYDKETGKRVGHAAGTDWILRLFEALNITEIGGMKGLPVVVYREGESMGDFIIGIRRVGVKTAFMIKDWQNKWFPKESK